jgi:hypothetical protein
MVGLYLHSPTRLRDLVLNKLSTRTNLKSFTFLYKFVQPHIALPSSFQSFSLAAHSQVASVLYELPLM